ncbi:MAG: hypothetical protein ACRDG4_13710 [Chloroflexota bacterium]
MTNNVDQRRRLRLGALLYQLRYYAVSDQRDKEGRIALYQHDPRRSVEIAGATVRLITGDQVEVLDIEAAIVRCKDALLGRPFHRVPSDQA